MKVGLSALAVDDEAPALDELAYLLRNCGLVSEVETAKSADDALRLLRHRTFDVVVLDIAMPGLGGIELASVLARFGDPPAIVFVTAHEDHALEAFEVGAVGYLLKPVDRDRLVQVLGRVSTGNPESAPADDLEFVPVEARGRTEMVSRTEVAWVESAGDYVRLHTLDGRAALVRIPLGRLEEAWSPDGFIRVHRQYLVALKAIKVLKGEGTQVFIEVDGTELPVSRRSVRELRDRLVRQARGHR